MTESVTGTTGEPKPPGATALPVPVPVAPREPRNILLFSDGTGNSSAKLFKTNVWRMYEAADLGPASPGKRPQLAFYDNGVGTSGFRPLAMLGGVFGFGLKRNVLEIYRYACRNYAPAPNQEPGQDEIVGGDEIYGFGFSRGAFTMRLVMALIASQGLVVSSDEADLARKSEDAFRAFRTEFEPRKLKWPTRLHRAIGTRFRRWRRARTGVPEYSRRNNYRPTISFVGVWDTVSAYGGPITEVTRAIDNWVYALSMPDYKLDPRVLCARHALAIDDERDAFHPLLWDEVYEQELVEKRQVAVDRMQQVWFTGMHADVGGGYPDESLSYVSLLWMLHEANARGLRTLEVVTERVRALASSAGPLHDSRSGPGAYYRYQPRKIGGWLRSPDPTTQFQQDPERVDAKGKPLGFLTSVQIHESVAARIAFGTDRYTPIGLPAAIKVVPPHPGGETVLQRDNFTPVVDPLARRASHPLLDRALRDRLEDVSFGTERVEKMEVVWDLVWRRRIVYFVSLALTLLLVFMPLWIGVMPEPPVLSDGRTWLSEIIRLPRLVLPEFLGAWVDTLARNTFYVLVLVVGLLAAVRIGNRLERRLRDHARAIWEHSLDLKNPSAGQTAQPHRRLRTAAAYQRLMQRLKWTWMPALIGALLAAVAVWALLGLGTQIWLPFAEKDGTLCPHPNGKVTQLDVVRFEFAPRTLCRTVGRSVSKGERYIVELRVIEQWRDATRATAPTGIRAKDMGLPGYIGLPLRRIVHARYLQPAYLIRSKRQWWQLSTPIYVQPLELAQAGGNAAIWRAEFTAQRTGDLALFANDSMLPAWFGLDHRFFYERTGGGNFGKACIVIYRAARIGAGGLQPPAVGSAC